MAAESVNIFTRGIENTAAALPAIIGAIVILLIGWIVGRLLGKAVKIIIDKATAAPLIGDSDFGKSVTKTGISLGHLGDIAVRIIMYLVAILAAVDLLNLDYLSQFMTDVVRYIPNVAAFAIILIVGIILTDYFIDFFRTYAKNASIEMMSVVLVPLRLFMYFVVVMLALSQLKIDLTIIYTIITPLAWGLGAGLAAAIAITVWFGMKNRSEQIIDRVMESLSK